MAAEQEGDGGAVSAAAAAVEAPYEEVCATVEAPAFVADASAVKVVWAKVGSHPYWPAQVLTRKAVNARPALQKTSRSKAAVVPVMFFGDNNSLGWLPEKMVLSWAEGVQNGCHKKSSARMKVGVREVAAFLAQEEPRVSPALWWCSPPGPGGEVVAIHPNRHPLPFAPTTAGVAADEPASPGGQSGMRWSARDVLKPFVNRLRRLFPMLAAQPVPGATNELFDWVRAYFAADLNLDQPLKGKTPADLLAQMFSHRSGGRITSAQAAQFVSSQHADEQGLAALGVDLVAWEASLPQIDPAKIPVSRRPPPALAGLSGWTDPSAPTLQVVNGRLVIPARVRAGKTVSAGAAASHTALYADEDDGGAEGEAASAAPRAGMDDPPSYIHVKQNVWVSRPRPKRFSKDEISVCNCRPPPLPMDFFSPVDANAAAAAQQEPVAMEVDAGAAEVNAETQQDDADDDAAIVRRMVQAIFAPYIVAQQQAQPAAVLAPGDAVGAAPAQLPPLPPPQQPAAAAAAMQRPGSRRGGASAGPSRPGSRMQSANSGSLDQGGAASASAGGPAVPSGASLPRDGCQEGCLNRLSFIHCDPRTCPCGERCSNRPFFQLEQPNMEVFLTVDKGWGVRAKEFVPRGKFVVEYAGEVVDDYEMKVRMEAARRANEPHFYMMEMSTGLIIDARPKGNVARLLNSSCDPNCETQKWHDAATGEVRVGIFTLRDVAPGEELVYDYHFQQLFGEGGGENGEYQCRCGAANCRGTMDAKVDRAADCGRRIEIWWPQDDCYYAGRVTGYSSVTGKHNIVYDDGESEKLDLKVEEYRWLVEEESPVEAIAAVIENVVAATVTACEPQQPVAAEPQQPQRRQRPQAPAVTLEGIAAAMEAPMVEPAAADDLESADSLPPAPMAPEPPSALPPVLPKLSALAPPMAAPAQKRGRGRPPGSVRKLPAVPHMAVPAAAMPAAAVPAVAVPMPSVVGLPEEMEALARQLLLEGACPGELPPLHALRAVLEPALSSALDHVELASASLLRNPPAAAPAAVPEGDVEMSPAGEEAVAPAEALVEEKKAEEQAAAAMDLPAPGEAPQDAEKKKKEEEGAPNNVLQPLENGCHTAAESAEQRQAAESCPPPPQAEAEQGKPADALAAFAAGPNSPPKAETVVVPSSATSSLLNGSPAALAPQPPLQLPLLRSLQEVMQTAAPAVATAHCASLRLRLSELRAYLERHAPAAAAAANKHIVDNPGAQAVAGRLHGNGMGKGPGRPRRNPAAANTAASPKASRQAQAAAAAAAAVPTSVSGRGRKRQRKIYGEDFLMEDSDQEGGAGAAGRAAVACGAPAAAIAAMAAAAAATPVEAAAPPAVSQPSAAPQEAVKVEAEAPNGVAVAGSPTAAEALPPAAAAVHVEQVQQLPPPSPTAAVAEAPAPTPAPAPATVAAPIAAPVHGRRGSGAGPRRGGPTPSSTGLPARTILVAKRLTNSDVSKGRILLPRAAVEANLSFAIGRAHSLVAKDHMGQAWEFTLQSWANGMESRRVYVLEHAGEYIRHHVLKLEDVIGISCTQEGEFLVEYNTEEVCSAAETQQAARATTASPQIHHAPAGGASGTNPLIQHNAGRCTRSEYCNKPAGHPGFCMRTPGGALKRQTAAAQARATAAAAAAATAAAEAQGHSTGHLATLGKRMPSFDEGARQKRSRRPPRKTSSYHLSTEEDEASYSELDDDEDDDEFDSGAAQAAMGGIDAERAALGGHAWGNCGMGSAAPGAGLPFGGAGAVDPSGALGVYASSTHAVAVGPGPAVMAAAHRSTPPPEMGPSVPPIFVMAADADAPPPMAPGMRSPLRPSFIARQNSSQPTRSVSHCSVASGDSAPPPQHAQQAPPAVLSGVPIEMAGGGASQQVSQQQQQVSNQQQQSHSQGTAPSGGAPQQQLPGQAKQAFPSLPRPVAAPQLPAVQPPSGGAFMLPPLQASMPVPPLSVPLFGGAPPLNAPGVALPGQPLQEANDQTDFDCMSFLNGEGK